MQLTHSADYALRALIYVGLHPEKRVTIREIAESFHISTNHLMKIVHRLSQLGFLSAQRGRSGGLVLGQAPEDINIGEVVLRMEPHFNLAECLNDVDGGCLIAPLCQVKHALQEAQLAFLAVLNRYTLADVLKAPEDIRLLLAV